MQELTFGLVVFVAGDGAADDCGLKYLVNTSIIDYSVLEHDKNITYK